MKFQKIKDKSWRYLGMLFGYFSWEDLKSHEVFPLLPGISVEWKNSDVSVERVNVARRP